MAQIIWIEPDAPPKPALGQPCNGCGLCCLAEPCPVGMLASRSRRGPCRALEWSTTQRQYRCGMLSRPAAWLGLPRSLSGGRVERVLVRWAHRMIAAGAGCDADLESLPPATDKP